KGAGARGSLGGGSLQPLFSTGARDDVVAVAPPERRSSLPVLGPEGLQVLVERLDVGRDLRVVALREEVPQLVPLFVHTLDLGVDVFDRSHVSCNETPGFSIPLVVSELGEPLFVES